MVASTFALLPLSLLLLVSAAPVKRAAFSKQNGIDAQALNTKFATLTAGASCNAGDIACADGGFAQCVGGSFVVQPCSAPLKCFGLPLVNKPGTTVTCTSEDDALARITASGATGGITGDGSSDSGDSSPSPPAAAPAPPAASGSGTVTVVGGDTCIGIAQANSVDVGALMAANPSVNSDCTNLEIGQDLTLPSGGDSAPADTPAPAASTPAPSSDVGGAAPAACENKRKRSLNPAMGLIKRIAQSDLGAVAQSWQDLCLKSGGDIQTNDPCVQLAGINGINSLLAGADPCAQQDNADAMIDFARSAGVTNTDDLIANAVAYRKHPRNALNINGDVPSTPFCQKAPRNAELNGLVNGQLDGVDPGLFGGPKFPIVPFGDPASCPFGQTPDVDTCSCN